MGATNNGRKMKKLNRFSQKYGHTENPLGILFFHSGF
jgi:hypothetical protein